MPGADSAYVADLGQNINGWTRLANLGPHGTELTVTHGEALDPAGDVTTDHLRPALPFLPAPPPVGTCSRHHGRGRGTNGPFEIKGFDFRTAPA